MSTAFSKRLIERLATAEHVVAFTGAGMSAESGVPTFRGNEGLWTKFKPEELANLGAFLRNPDMVWEWYAHRKRVMSGVEPNLGHLALVTMEAMFPQFTVITQNIDNLHRRAGSRVVHELHGNIERNYCMQCGTVYSNPEVLAAAGPPRCTRTIRSEKVCNGLIRPDVVWFGELLPEEEWNSSVAAAASSDVFLSIGTSGVVYPAASLIQVAKQGGAFLIEVNPEATSFSTYVDEFLKGPAGEVLPALLAMIEKHRASPDHEGNPKLMER